MSEAKPAKVPERFIRLLAKAMDAHPQKPSLRQVAREADISATYLSYLLNGKRSVPSNDAIARLEEVLNIPKSELFKAAAKPDDAALDFFRKDEAASIVRKLAPLSNKQLSAVHKLIDRFVKAAK